MKAIDEKAEEIAEAVQRFKRYRTKHRQLSEAAERAYWEAMGAKAPSSGP